MSEENIMTLVKKQGLIAGDGELPVKLAMSAKKQGFEVVGISLSATNRLALRNYCSELYVSGPGELLKIRDIIKKEKIEQLTFIGKVHKGMLLKNPKLDKLAMSLIKQIKTLNDDAIMLALIEELEKENVTVIDQTIFIKELMAQKGVLGKHQPTEEQLIDIEYGFNIAKEMGRLDIGQSVIVKDKMILAIEAIEGTDKAIERGCKLGKKGSIVVKVSKPMQDKRFDIPTVGLRTLKNMKRFGGNVLAVEAGETLIVEREKMIEFANKNNIVVVAV